MAPKRAVRPSWDTYGLALAHTATMRADCTRARVGAVVMNRRHEIRGIGYNGAAAGEPGCASAGACPRGKLSLAECPRDSDYSNCVAIHAEANALRFTPPDELPGATLYVTREPCPDCWRLIRRKGIARVVTPEREYLLAH